MDLDEALHHAGGFGSYQRLVGWLLLLPGALPVGLYTLLVLLHASDRGHHWCSVPELQESALNETLAKRFSIPVTRGGNSSLEFSSCLMYDVNYTHLVRHFAAGSSRDNSSDLTAFPTSWPVTSCRCGWQHERDKTLSMIAKFELVCDRSRLTSALVAGVGAGAVIGQLVVFSCRHRVSRRGTFLLSLLLYLAVGVGSVSCQRPLCLLLTSCTVSAAAAALSFNQLSLVLQLTPASDHQLGHVTERLVTCGGVLLLAGVAALTRQWNTAVYAVVLPCAVFLVYWCVMPESPAWLLSRGYWSELYRLLEKIARVNGQPTDVAYITEQIQENVEDEIVLSWEDLFFSNRQQRRLATLFLLILLSSLMYHQTAAAAAARWPSAGRPLLLLAAAQLLACPLAWAAAQAAGRRSSLLVSLSLTAAACSLAAFLNHRDNASAAALDSLTFLLTVLSEVSLLLLLLTGCSLLPSLLPSHGLLLLRSAQLLGYATQPALSLLLSEWQLLVVLAGLHGLGAVAALLLPETLHQPRPRLPSESHRIRWPVFQFRPRPPRLHSRHCCSWHSAQTPNSRHQLTSPTSAPITHGVSAQRETSELRSDHLSANGGLVLGVPSAPRPPTLRREDQMYITVL